LPVDVLLLMLVAAALLAAYGPVARAAAVHPMSALRVDE
jgi:ABC-type lipoprotein release transport system permease subunit